MNTKKYFEIRLSLLQILLSLCALIGCFFFAFTLGAFMGSRFIQSLNTTDSASPRPNLATAHPVSDYNSLESLNPPADESSKNLADMTFYDELTQTVEISPSPARQKPKAGTSGSMPSAGNDPAPGPVEKAVKETAYTIQIAAFLQKEKAYALANTLISQGYPARVVSNVNPGGETWHRVRVGRFTSPEEAKRLLPPLSQLASQPRITPAE
jgi:cell division septation protein DedD